MPAFHEVQFPVDISRGSSGGPMRVTDIVPLRSGFEERNSIWADSLHQYDAGIGLRDMTDVYEVKKFFEARKAKLYGFRWKDWSDFKSGDPTVAVTPLDQAIGTGDGATATFQLKKTYTSGGYSYVRNIKKPVSGTVRVSVAGVEKTITTHWTVNLTTGIITFTGGNIPTLGQAVTAGFEFDVPARFDQDMLNINVELFNVGEVQSIKIMELRV